ncbi:C40 family peptidase [Arthrobacter silvisoli]|uniref:C40 family peptidase n=1 Tax=Arthrobacter silvisoli TaxID=2291022 RepID=UPI000E20FADD|nr:C40 family peptidase [Arthrobacter silvisoli]
MAVHALVVGLVKRRVLLRACVAAVAAMTLVGAFAFCAGIAVLGANAATFSEVCSPDSAGGAAAGHGAAAVSVRTRDETLATFTARQMAVARDYVSIGRQLGVPREGQIIAIMMALQESSLRVLANVNVPASLSYPHDGVGSDHDSLGTAQQRPAAGWGSVAQLMDPAYNVQAFYGGPASPNHGSPPGLLDIQGWQTMSKGQAAQAVQVSAFPELYERWELQAAAIVDALDGGVALAECPVAEDGSGRPADTANLSQIRRDILRFAQGGVGGTYIWGGTAFKAWDCSGYVQWIYRQVGINLPRTEQWAVGKRTDKPLPGDLVVQNADGPNHWGHVGIYAGDGMMYSALNPVVGTLVHPITWNSDTAYFNLLI